MVIHCRSSAIFRAAVLGVFMAAASVVAVGAQVASSAASRGYDPPYHPDEYTGPLQGSPDGSVGFDVERVEGVPQEVSFEAFNVRRRCSDGTVYYGYFTLSEYSFEIETRPRFFHGRYPEYFNGPPGYGGHFKVRGRLLKGGKAKGVLESTAHIPPEDGLTCNTDGPLRWAATRRD